MLHPRCDHLCCYRLSFSAHQTAGHASTIGTLSYAIRFWSKGTKRALFLRHEGFLSVLLSSPVGRHNRALMIALTWQWLYWRMDQTCGCLTTAVRTSRFAPVRQCRYGQHSGLVDFGGHFVHGKGAAGNDALLISSRISEDRRARQRLIGDRRP
jgi:hypothetical protein